MGLPRGAERGMPYIEHGERNEADLLNKERTTEACARRAVAAAAELPPSLQLVIGCCAAASLLVAVVVAHGIHVLRVGDSLGGEGACQHSVGLQVECSAMLLGAQPGLPAFPESYNNLHPAPVAPSW